MGSYHVKGKLFAFSVYFVLVKDKMQKASFMTYCYCPDTWSSKGKIGLVIILYSCNKCLFISLLLRLSPAAYYAQRMIQYLSRRDSIRQRSMRYQQNRLRSSSSSSASENSSPSVEGNDIEFEDFE